MSRSSNRRSSKSNAISLWKRRRARDLSRSRRVTGVHVEPLEQRRMLASIHGQKFHDLNANGQFEADEPGLNGWTIELRDDFGVLITSAETMDMDLNEDGVIDPNSESGLVWFEDLDSGSYFVNEVRQDGWIQSTSDPIANPLIELQTQFDFYVQDQFDDEDENLFFDVNGEGEKFIRARNVGEFVTDPINHPTGEWFYILPGGDLFNWDEISGNGFGLPGPLNGVLVANVGDDVYDNPRLLMGANIEGSSLVLDLEDTAVVDFGNYQLGSLHGRKFHDLNVDGMHDAGEEYLNDWEIQLLDADGQVLDTQLTADMDIDGDGTIDPLTESGWYWFDDLVPNVYTVREVVKDGWFQSAPDDGVVDEAPPEDDVPIIIEGGDEMMDGEPADGEPADGEPADGEPADGEPADGEPADGEPADGEPADGEPADGEPADGEPADGEPADGEPADSEPADGEPADGEPADGEPADGEPADGEPADGEPADGEPAADVPGEGYEVELTSGERIEGLDFGNYQLGSIHGRKWHDLNADGIIDAGEPYLNNWTIELIGADGSVIATTTTMDDDRDGDGTIDPATESGWYWLVDIVPGDYSVREVIPDGWIPSSPAGGIQNVTVASSRATNGVDFGNYRNASVHGRKWHDLNANGVYDDGEPYLNDWTIEVVDVSGAVVATAVTHDQDLDGDGVIDPTTESGWYWIDGLTPAKYSVREVQQDEWIQSAPARDVSTTFALGAGQEVPLTDSQATGTCDATLNASRTSFQIDCTHDVAGATAAHIHRGVAGEAGPVVIGFDSGESPLSLTWDSITHSQVDELLSEGFYVNVHSDAFPPGEIRGQITGLDSSAASHEVTLISGDRAEDLDFGNYLHGSIHGRKWHDLNNDGVLDEGEPYLNGWEIELLNAGGAVVATTTTHDEDIDGDGVIDPATESGWYWLTKIRPGSYVVRETPQDGFVQNAPVGLVHTVEVTSGAIVNDISFGNADLTVDIIDVTPDPRAGSVASISIQFSHPIAGFEKEDLSLTRTNDGTVDVSLETATLDGLSGDLVWELGNLGALTAEAGIYVLTLDAASAGIAAQQAGTALLVGDVDSLINAPGDANRNGRFDQFDLVEVLVLDTFGKDEDTNWSGGDWTGNQRFNDEDLDTAKVPGHYLQGPYNLVEAVDEAMAQGVV